MSNSYEITTGRKKPSELVEEYETKLGQLEMWWTNYQSAIGDLRLASAIGGTFGHVNLDFGRVDLRDFEKHLLRSAWRHTFELYNLDVLATAKDKSRLQLMFENPPAFNVENLREQFGSYIADPWQNILRGLAEVFSSLDPYYRSHEKMKIGVKGLPKRIIINNVSDYGWGRDRLADVLNALAAYQGIPLVTHTEILDILDDGESLKEDREIVDREDRQRYEREMRYHKEGRDLPEPPKMKKVIGRGVWLKRFANGNGHLFFSPKALRDINMALSQYYGDVLPDTPDENPAKPTGTAVSKDLAFYPTPKTAIERAFGDAYLRPESKVLEPSCGDGRVMEYVRSRGSFDVTGIEIDANRVRECRSKGLSVIEKNFLDVQPEGVYDYILMNPPFVGKHYQKHVTHALKFLKSDGVLFAILPATAQYDHEFKVPGYQMQWMDLPVGSFSESGTNVNTVYVKMYKR